MHVDELLRPSNQVGQELVIELAPAHLVAGCATNMLYSAQENVSSGWTVFAAHLVHTQRLRVDRAQWRPVPAPPAQIVSNRMAACFWQQPALNLALFVG